MHNIKAFLGTLVAFLVVDLAWITFVIGPLYQREVGALMLETPNLAAAMAFYLFYAAAIVALAVRPARRERRLGRAAIDGALLGAVAYGTFTITNYALIDGWTLTLVATDIPWGAFLTAVSATAGYKAAGPAPD